MVLQEMYMLKFEHCEYRYVYAAEDCSKKCLCRVFSVHGGYSKKGISEEDQTLFDQMQVQNYVHWNTHTANYPK